MKTFPVTLTITFSIDASKEEVAQERVEAVVDALVSFKAPKPFPQWWPDLDAPEIEIEEGEQS